MSSVWDPCPGKSTAVGTCGTTPPFPSGYANPRQTGELPPRRGVGDDAVGGAGECAAVGEQGGELCGDAERLVADLRPGEADDDVPAREEVCVACAVVVEAEAMTLSAVGLRDHALRGRHQQPIVPGGLDLARMHPHPFATPWAAAGDRHVDARRLGGQERPEVGDRLVGERCVVADGEERGNGLTAEGDRLMADRVDPAVPLDQRAGLEPAGDRAPIEPERDDLIPADDTLLPRRQPTVQNVAPLPLAHSPATLCTHAVQNVERNREDKVGATLCTHRPSMPPTRRGSAADPGSAHS